MKPGGKVSEKGKASVCVCRNILADSVFVMNKRTLRYSNMAKEDTLFIGDVPIKTSIDRVFSSQPRSIFV